MPSVPQGGTHRIKVCIIIFWHTLKSVHKTLISTLFYSAADFIRQKKNQCYSIYTAGKTVQSTTCSMIFSMAEPFPL